MEYIKSPINYTGNKYRLLDEIIPKFPHDINTFLDVFGGSGTVTLNVQANNKIYNEIDFKLYGMINLFKEKDADFIISHILNRVKEYNLKRGTDSRKIVSIEQKNENEEIKQNFLKFRDFLNKESTTKELDLLAIHYYSFNNLIRNTKTNHNNFNVPSGVGSKSFVLERNGVSIKYACEEFKKIIITNYDFRNIDYSILTPFDFVYLDPPYYLSNAEYNRKWDKNTEQYLYNICDDLTKRNVKWAMSNMIMNNNIEHTLLREWCLKNNYSIHYINTKYNGWAGKKLIDYKNTMEVLITNY